MYYNVPALIPDLRYFRCERRQCEQGEQSLGVQLETAIQCDPLSDKTSGGSQEDDHIPYVGCHVRRPDAVIWFVLVLYFISYLRIFFDIQNGVLFVFTS